MVRVFFPAFLVAFSHFSQVWSSVCSVDSSNIVLAAASCARSANPDECGSKEYCQWNCPDKTLTATTKSGCGPHTDTKCVGLQRDFCLAAETCSWQYCCNLKQDHLDTIMAKDSLLDACSTLEEVACTRELACTWSNHSCAVAEENLIDAEDRRVLWSFTGIGSNLTGGPWKANFMELYNLEYERECSKNKSSGIACTKTVSQNYLVTHMSDESIRHLHESAACSAASSRKECAAQAGCEWILGAGEVRNEFSCTLSPESAAQTFQLQNKDENCTVPGLPVQILCYSLFGLLAILAVAGDVSRNGKDALREWVGVLQENIVSIGCLSLFIALYTLVFLRFWVLDLSAVMGLVITIVGLTIFARGLATGLMPLAENVGRDLPARIPIPAVLVVIFCLGVLCTIAEPSIQALQAAGENVDFNSAPFVHLLLDPAYVPETGDAPQNWVFVMQIIVGVGVGVAAVIGTLRLVLAHGVKKYAFTTFIPPQLMTLLACFFFAKAPEHLDRSTGLAWDCGAVTTGPVTVPIVLALGIGMAAASRAKREAAAAGTAPAPLTASVFSSRAGQNSLLVDHNIDRRSKSIISGSLMSGANRQVAADAEAAVNGEAKEEAPNLDGFGIVTFASLLPAFTVWALTFFTYSKFNEDVAAAVGENPMCPASVSLVGVDEVLGTPPLTPFWCTFIAGVMASVQAVGPLVGFLFMAQFVLVRRVPEGVFGLAYGCVVTLLGMVCFNIGLVKSLNPIGNKVGELMPGAQDYYGTAAGDVVMLVFGFLAGLGATFSEPALSALGDTVHALTKGEFKKSSLIGSVALGVGVGIVIGLAKIRYGLPLWIILVCAYVIAFALTAVSEEAITCVAWDSAGVTTGPVTVPIVLALGGSIAKTNHVAEGFGILSCASFGPIIAVLLSAKLQEMTKRKRNNLSPAMLDN